MVLKLPWCSYSLHSIDPYPDQIHLPQVPVEQSRLKLRTCFFEFIAVITNGHLSLPHPAEKNALLPVLVLARVISTNEVATKC